MKRTNLAWVCAAVLLAGCAAVPQRYYSLAAPADAAGRPAAGAAV